MLGQSFIRQCCFQTLIYFFISPTFFSTDTLFVTFNHFMNLHDYVNISWKTYDADIYNTYATLQDNVEKIYVETD